MGCQQALEEIEGRVERQIALTDVGSHTRAESSCLRLGHLDR
jgi:hypothetical protein